MIDVSSNGAIIPNVGRELEEIPAIDGRRNDRRHRTVKRHLSVISRHKSALARNRFERAERKIMSTLRESLEHGDPPTCLLDMVKPVLDAIGNQVDGTSFTLEEVAQMFQLTRERIRQIEVKALLKVRAEARANENTTEMAEWEKHRRNNAQQW